MPTLSVSIFGASTLRVFLLAISFMLIAGTLYGEDKQAPEQDENRRLTADDFPSEMRSQLTVAEPERVLPFRSGEVLHYRVGWGIFTVGSAELAIEKITHQDQPVWKLTLTSRTNAFADAFYKVRNHTSSWINHTFTRTIYYENLQNEGERQRDVVVQFDWEKNLAHYHNRLDPETKEPWIPILDGSFDPMAITYFVRSLPLQEGATYMVPTTTGREQFVTMVKVDRKERRRFKTGRQDAFVLVPDIKDLGGVFQRSSRANITFWFSADESRFPLRMESSVSVGSFWAELVEVEHR